MMTARRSEGGGWTATFLRSFAAKTVLLIVVFFVVPAIIYQQLRAADQDRRRLLLRGLEAQARLVGEALRPQLASFDGKSARGLDEMLQRLLVERGFRVKLLLRPRGQQGGGFYYIAAAPAVPNAYLEEERTELIKTGVLERLPESCRGNRPLAVRYVNPAGEEEVLTAIAPLQTDGGCWAVITSADTSLELGAAVGKPYWRTPEVQIAAAIYLAMALLVLSMFLGVWRNLRAFARAAWYVRARGEGGRAFATFNRIPELAGVAAEFDRMVDTLRASAQALRHAAEDNAHAFKTPIATIAQSLEPLKRRVRADDQRGRRALELIERALGRLDDLVAAARRMDQAAAELLQPPDERVDLSRLAAGVLEGYAEVFEGKGLQIEREVAPNVAVRAGEELLETVIENLLDNAIDFSPEGGTLRVDVAAEGAWAVLAVADEGPGVSPGRQQQIFERYVSSREGEPPAGESGRHFGIGLWLVRRNVEAVGGQVEAENRKPRGLRIVVRLPREH